MIHLITVSHLPQENDFPRPTPDIQPFPTFRILTPCTFYRYRGNYESLTLVGATRRRTVADCPSHGPCMAWKCSSSSIKGTKTRLRIANRSFFRNKVHTCRMITDAQTSIQCRVVHPNMGESALGLQFDRSLLFDHHRHKQFRLQAF